MSARAHRSNRLIWIMVNFTVGYGAQYRTNHRRDFAALRSSIGFSVAATYIYTRPLVLSYAYVRRIVRSCVTGAVCVQVTRTYTRQRVAHTHARARAHTHTHTHAHTHTHTHTHTDTYSRARVIDGQIKLRDGSIRDEAIDFEMLDFVSISSTDRTRKASDNAPPGQIHARIMGQIER